MKLNIYSTLYTLDVDLKNGENCKVERPYRKVHTKSSQYRIDTFGELNIQKSWKYY